MTEKSNKNAILVITAIGGFLAPFMASLINVALPAISTEYKMDAMEVGWIATSYLLSAAVFLLLYCKLADIYGRKKIYLIGITVFSIASILTTTMLTIATFITIRIIHGFAAVMIFSTEIAIVTSAFPSVRKKEECLESM
jgi:MFS family permease